MSNAHASGGLEVLVSKTGHAQHPTVCFPMLFWRTDMSSIQLFVSGARSKDGHEQGRLSVRLSACPSAQTRLRFARLFLVQAKELFTHPPGSLALNKILMKKLTCTLERGVQDENMLT